MPAIGMPTVIATLIHGNDKPWHDRFIAALPAEATVLDLGCGSGSPVAKHMAEHGLHVTGVD
jgi:2-polyprenyl-3-methyl-5-hydroxy-6-metoxy-1,4-benzoquinol methylase